MPIHYEQHQNFQELLRNVFWATTPAVIAMFDQQINSESEGGPHSTMDSVLALHPASPCLILSILEDFFPSGISFDGAEIYQLHCTA